MGKVSGRSAWINAFALIAVAVIGGAVTIWTQRDHEPPKEAPKVPPSDTGDTAVMGQLEPGINRQGMDFSDTAITTENAEVCAEECRKNQECKAMTYVVSRRTCWLKKGVPPPYPPGGSEYISAVKVER